MSFLTLLTLRTILNGERMMSRKRIAASCGLLAGLLFVSVLAGDYKDLQDIMSMIRHDKFDYVLPKAMRNNKIDM